MVGKSQVVNLPRSAKVIDGTGKFVIPGLWDMHTHFRDADRDLKMDLANGVLGTRNMGGSAKEVFPIRGAIATGQQLGPKIAASGSIVDGPNSWSNPKFTVSVSTAEEARSAVIALKKEGADFIKVYDGLPPSAYFAIANETKKLGFPFAGHRPSAISVKEASNAGQRSIEHGVVLSGGRMRAVAYPTSFTFSWRRSSWLRSCHPPRTLACYETRSTSLSGYTEYAVNQALTR